MTLIPNKKQRTVADWLHAQEYHDKMKAQGIPVPRVFLIELEELRKMFGPPLPVRKKTGPRSREFAPGELVRHNSASDFKDKREPAISYGDYVVLNSGSTPMLVLDHPRDGRALCGWYNANGEAVEHSINVECISRIDVLKHLPAFIVPPTYK